MDIAIATTSVYMATSNNTNGHRYSNHQFVYGYNTMGIAKQNDPTVMLCNQ